MDRRTFKTPPGDVWLWGRPEAFDGSGLVVLTITGAFAAERAMRPVQGQFPDTPILFARIPGNYCPILATHSVSAYAAAYSAVLRQLDRPAVVLGVSLGATVAMAIDAPNLVGIVALEPVLRTGEAWPLHDRFGDMLRADPENPGLRAFLWSVFGISEDRIEDRDYLGALDGLTAPTHALFGSEPLLPRRPVSRLPSLVSEATRLAIRSHTLVRSEVVSGVGHDIGEGASSRIDEALRGMLHIAGAVA